MAHSALFLSTLALIALLLGCADQNAGGERPAADGVQLSGASERERDRAAGWRALTGQDLVDLRVGNTLIGDDFAVYYAADGRKLGEVDGEKVARRWAIDDGGRFCEQALQNGAQMCADPSSFLFRDGRVRQYDDTGDLSVQYDVVDGDALDLG